MKDEIADILQRNGELEKLMLRRLEQLAYDGADGRWLAVARTQIEQGFMAANRAVAEAGLKQLAASLQEG